MAGRLRPIEERDRIRRAQALGVLPGYNEAISGSWVGV